MFSFAGDTVLDPFMGTATTNLAAARWGRDSIGVEVDPHYFQSAKERLAAYAQQFFNRLQVHAIEPMDTHT